MKLILLSLFLILLQSLPSFALQNCTPAKKIAVCEDSLIQENVDWACKQLAENGKSALLQINSMRFECCGEPNYIWINDFTPRMIVHPLKPNMNGMNLKEEIDPSGNKIFVLFAEAAAKHKDGSWVKYEWPKFGDKKATTKRAWVRSCKAKDLPQDWVVGSGTWE